MSTKNKLDKVAYVMLNIAAIVTSVIVLGIIGLAIFLTVYAVNDTLAGGWILFIMGLFGIVLCPMIGSWIAQCILQLLGWIQYRKNNMIPARIFGLINSILSLLSNAFLLYMFFSMSFDGDGDATVWLVEIIILGICIIYMAIPFVLLIISMCKKNKTI